MCRWSRPARPRRPRDDEHEHEHEHLGGFYFAIAKHELTEGTVWLGGTFFVYVAKLNDAGMISIAPSSSFSCHYACARLQIQFDAKNNVTAMESH